MEINLVHILNFENKLNNMELAKSLISYPYELIGKKDYINRDVNNEPKTGVLFTNFIIKTINRKAKKYIIAETILIKS